MKFPLKILMLLLVASACGEFTPNPLGPGSPGGGGGGGGATNPDVAVPFKIGGLELDEGRGVASVSDGVVLASWFTGSVDFDPRSGTTLRTSLGDQDIAVSKYDNDGAFQWVYTVGSAGAEVPNGVAATPDGGVIVVGHGRGGVCAGRTLVGHGGKDILLIKMSAGGVCEWAQLLGGADDDAANAVAVDSDGSMVVAGLFTGTVDFDESGGTSLLVSKGSGDGFLARFASDGSLIDVTQGGGPEDDQFNDLAISPDHELTVVGTIRGTATFGSNLAPALLVSAGQADVAVARYSEFFGLRWARRVGGPMDDLGTAITTDPSGNPLVGGSFEGTADLDPGAGAALVVSKGLADIFMSSYAAASGDWTGVAGAIGGPGGEGITSLNSNGQGLALATGWFQETVDFDPGPGTTFLLAKGTSGAGDAFLAAFAPGSGLAWVGQIGGQVAGDDNLSLASAAALDQSGGVWLTGRFVGQSDFDPLSAEVVLTPTGKSDAFVARYRVTSGTLDVVDIPDSASP